MGKLLIRGGRNLYITPELADLMGIERKRQLIQLRKQDNQLFLKPTNIWDATRTTLDFKQKENGSYMQRNVNACDDIMKCMGLPFGTLDADITIKQLFDSSKRTFMMHTVEIRDRVQVTPSIHLDADDDAPVFTAEANYEFRVKHSNGKWKYGIE